MKTGDYKHISLFSWMRVGNVSIEQPYDHNKYIEKGEKREYSRWPCTPTDLSSRNSEKNGERKQQLYGMIMT